MKKLEGADGADGQDPATPDEMIFDVEPPGANWKTMRRYKMLRAAQLGFRRTVEATEGALQTLVEVGYFNIREAAHRGRAARVVVEHLILIGAIDLISPGLAVEAVEDERDRLSRRASELRLAKKRRK